MIVIDTKKDAQLIREIANNLKTKRLTPMQLTMYGVQLQKLVDQSFIYDGGNWRHG